jgi:hypothetical protein
LVDGVLDLRIPPVKVREERQPFLEPAQQERCDRRPWLPDRIGADQRRKRKALQPVEEDRLIVAAEGRCGVQRRI